MYYFEQGLSRYRYQFMPEPTGNRGKSGFLSANKAVPAAEASGNDSVAKEDYVRCCVYADFPMYVKIDDQN